MSDENLERLRAMRYPVKISFDAEDHVYIADYFDLPGCSASGDTVQEAYDRAQEAKDEWLRVTSEQGLPIPKPSQDQEYSGRILTRVPSALHAMLSDRAKLHGVSLNQYLVYLLSSGIVGDKVSTELDELKAKISQLEWRVAKLTTTIQPQEVQVSNVAAKAFVSTNVVANPHIASNAVLVSGTHITGNRVFFQDLTQFTGHPIGGFTQDFVQVEQDDISTLPIVCSTSQLNVVSRAPKALRQKTARTK